MTFCARVADKSDWIEGGTGPWEIIIGLEVHAQVSSKSKLFSGASAEYGGAPNDHVSLVDAAMRQLHAEGWMHNRLRMVTAQLLTKNPAARLGYDDEREIFDHDWFQDIDFADLYNKKIPALIIPNLDEEESVENFSKKITGH